MRGYDAPSGNGASGAKGIIQMASQSKQPPSSDEIVQIEPLPSPSETVQTEPPPSHGEIIQFVPRHLLRRDTHNLIAASAADIPMPDVRRMLADACTRYGSALVRELGRTIDHSAHPTALIAIRLLLLIADDPAQAVLWRVANDETRHPLQRLEALRGLYQQGHAVTLAQLVALASQAERPPSPRERELP